MAFPRTTKRSTRMGISVKGAIVIARYGHAWRGIKPKVAAEHGAVGCIIYSDPRDDGYSAGETYPQGALRPREGVQRGSVQDYTEFMRRSADAGRRRDRRREAPADQERADDSQRFPCCRFPTAMRTATCRDHRPGRSRSVARRLADHLSHRPRPGESSSERCSRTGT